MRGREAGRRSAQGQLLCQGLRPFSVDQNMHATRYNLLGRVVRPFRQGNRTKIDDNHPKGGL